MINSYRNYQSKVKKVLMYFFNKEFYFFSVVFNVRTRF